MKLIDRTRDLAEIQKLIELFPATAILGQRQCGKTTIAGQFKYDHYFDLENPRDLAILDHPQLALENLSGLIVIDEIQRKPDLFPLLRYLVDTNPNQKYLILGSASRNLLKQSSESLAGRIGYYHLNGFRTSDVGKEQMVRLWLRGGLPRSYLANSEEASLLWRENYISTFLERDIPQLGIQIPALTLRRFWTMISHYHGQILNYSELGRSFGISDMTVRKYIDILEATFMLRILHSWHLNIKKRLVKQPKIYIRDSGIFHSLQSIATHKQLLSHSKLGASWEGFALERLCQHINKRNNKVYYWRTHNGAEIDLFWQKNGKNWGAEFKYTDSPRLSKSMSIAMNDLQLEYLWVIYPGSQYYQLAKNITVLPLQIINKIDEMTQPG